MIGQLYLVLILTCVAEVVSGTSVEQLTEASNNFSFKLYLQIANGADNVIYSPFSIHSALTLAYFGARGTTATQMSQVLGLSSQNALSSANDSSPHHAYRELITQINSVENVELDSANAVFLNPRFPVLPNFTREAEENYFSLVSNFDLAGQEPPEKPVNDFVANRTRNYIKKILAPGSIDSSTVMVLINALYFRGTWAKQFKNRTTRKQDFHKLNGVTSQVDMMTDTREVDFKSDEQRGLGVIQIPFVNRRLGLYIALPREVEGIKKLESDLKTTGNFSYIFTGLERTRAKIGVPKFKIESSLSLKESLQKLGMKDAFNQVSADFSGISPQGVFISDVQHKAVIHVQETGTVAAAATSVTITAKSMPLPPQQSFIADHPFMFFLYDNVLKEILFQGRFLG